LDAFALHRRKAGQREDHGVGAGPQVDDLVLPLRIGGDGADLLDERRTAGFNRDARHHGAARVSDDPGDPARLREDELRRRRADSKNPKEHVRDPAHRPSLTSAGTTERKKAAKQESESARPTVPTA